MAIDLMHNDVKQCFRGSNGSNAGMCSDVAGPSSSGSGDFFELSDSLRLLFPPLLALLVAILDLSVTTTSILPFGTFYVIMHKVYYRQLKSFSYFSFSMTEFLFPWASVFRSVYQLFVSNIQTSSSFTC